MIQYDPLNPRDKSGMPPHGGIFDGLLRIIREFEELDENSPGA